MAEQTQGLQHPECYARALGGCSRIVSGEHYVSEGVLELVEGSNGRVSKVVRTTGLSFQRPGEVTPLGVASLVGNILCKTHNSLLSDFDQVGKDMFLAMDVLNEAAGDPMSPCRTIYVNGDRLEGWLLKTFLGGLYSGNFRVAEDVPTKGVCPPREWLDVLYNGADLPEGTGMYYRPAAPGTAITADQHVLRFSPLRSQVAAEVVGMQAWFFGFEFALLMGRLPADVPTMFDGASFRPAGLRVDGSETRIRFDWKGGSVTPDIVFRRVVP